MPSTNHDKRWDQFADDEVRVIREALELLVRDQPAPKPGRAVLLLAWMPDRP